MARFAKISIKDLAREISQAAGFKGKTEWDLTKPDGTFKKQLDVSKLISLGWKPKIKLKENFFKDFSIIKSIAESDMDRPVLMLNLNRYFESVSFPDGKRYKSYMDVLSKLLESLGGKIPVSYTHLTLPTKRIV